jgi:hypothetical protein
MYLLLKSIYFALATATTAIPPVQQVQEYSLAYQPKEGSSMTYKLTGDMDLQGVQAQMTSTVVQKVLKVDTDGTYSVQSNTTGGQVQFSGQLMKIPLNQSVTTYKANGDILSVTGDQIDPSNLRAEMLTMLRRPDGKVKIGDSWQLEVKADAAAKSPSLHGSFKFVGEELVGTIPTLKVEAKVTEGDIANGGNTDTTYWLSKDDGSYVKYECHYVNMPFAGAPAPMSGSLSMMRVQKP